MNRRLKVEKHHDPDGWAVGVAVYRTTPEYRFSWGIQRGAATRYVEVHFGRTSLCWSWEVIS